MYEAYVIFSIGDGITIESWEHKNELAEKITSVLWRKKLATSLEGTVLIEAIETKQLASATNDIFGIGMLDVLCVPIAKDGVVVEVVGFYKESE